MVSRNGAVTISKGYMEIESYLQAIREEAFTEKDPVVYHMRISTQAGRTAEMTHPFPLSDDLRHLTALDISSCSIGVAHNGIISLTSDPKDTISDTARFIKEYMVKLIRKPEDIHDPALQRILYELTHSRLALMDGSGSIALIGQWIEDDGMSFSNSGFREMPRITYRSVKGSGNTASRSSGTTEKPVKLG